MSRPVAIPPRSGSRDVYGSSPLGSSFDSFDAPSWSAGHSTAALYGVSPPSKPGSFERRVAPHSEAKKFLKRLKYDASLDSSEFTVGYIETTEQPERKSGAEAWSMRAHDRLVELPYAQFAGRFEDGAVPFHRIAYFKQSGTVAWESEHHRKLAADLAAVALGGLSPGTPTSGSCFMAGGHACAGRVQRQPSPTVAAAAMRGGPSDGDAGAAEGRLAAASDGEDATASAATASAVEEPALVDFAELPEECWADVLRHVGVRELCMVGRVNRWLRGVTTRSDLWRHQYAEIFGDAPDASWAPATVRRMCRRSELRAARWLEAATVEQLLGWPGTAVLQMDDTKVFSADGSSVRVWSHTTGRRLATLQGHPGHVQALAFDDEMILSGDDHNKLLLWSMDELKCLRTLRFHAAPVTDCLLSNSVPISASGDGTICFWDVNTSQPIMVLDLHGASVNTLQVHTQNEYLVAGGDDIVMYDINTAQVLAKLCGGEDASAAQTAYGLHPFTCLSYEPTNGGLLAAGTAGEVVLVDPRSLEVITTLQRGHTTARCVGVQLDDWKLVTGFDNGGNSLSVHDIRTVRSSRTTKWLQPVQTLSTPGQVTCFKFRNQSLVAGQANADCLLMTFGAPAEAAAAAAAAVAGAANPAGTPGGDSSGAAETSGSGRKKKNAGKPAKKQSRYPKRATR